jgi:hypothetical protein
MSSRIACNNPLAVSRSYMTIKIIFLNLYISSPPYQKPVLVIHTGSTCLWLPSGQTQPFSLPWDLETAVKHCVWKNVRENAVHILTRYKEERKKINIVVLHF